MLCILSTVLVNDDYYAIMFVKLPVLVIQVYATRYNPNNSKLVLHVIYEMQKREAYRVDIVSERQAAIPRVLELAGNIGGP